MRCESTVTVKPVYWDHLSIETSVDWPMGLLSDTNAPLYKEHLSTKATVAGLNRQVPPPPKPTLCTQLHMFILRL